MAVPKSKISNSRRGMRRAHDRLSAVNYVEDKDSGELRRQHHIDLKTGMYRGTTIHTCLKVDVVLTTKFTAIFVFYVINRR